MSDVFPFSAGEFILNSLEPAEFVFSGRGAEVEAVRGASSAAAAATSLDLGPFPS